MNKARNRDFTSPIVEHRMRYVTRELDKYMRISLKDEIHRLSTLNFNGVNVSEMCLCWNFSANSSTCDSCGGIVVNLLNT